MICHLRKPCLVAAYNPSMDGKSSGQFAAFCTGTCGKRGEIGPDESESTVKNWGEDSRLNLSNTVYVKMLMMASVSSYCSYGILKAHSSVGSIPVVRTQAFWFFHGQESFEQEQGQKMLRFRHYWIYSAGLAIAWAIVLFLALMIGGSESAQTLLLVFLGF